MTLFEAIHATVRRLQYSPRTEEAYLHWIRAFVRFRGRRHPRALGAPEIVAFLDALAVNHAVSASTSNQALCAIVFLYRRVLDLPVPDLDGLQRARLPAHLPAVLSRREVTLLLDCLDPPFRLIGTLLYGSCLRLMEAVSLRAKDVDLERRRITIRRGKGAQDRPALLPLALRDPLRAQLELVAARHRAEVVAGRGEIDLPRALRAKLPSMATALAWQYLFPASRPCAAPATGALVLHHLHETAVQKAISAAARAARRS